MTDKGLASQKQKVVALFGGSLLMDTVETALEDRREVGVIRIHTTVEGAVNHLRSLRPDLVIVELGDAFKRLIPALVKLDRSVPVLCLDLSRSQVITLNSARYSTATTDDLVDVIHAQAFNGLEPAIPVQGWDKKTIASLALAAVMPPEPA